MCLVFVCGRNREKRRKKTQTHSRRPQMLLPHSRSLSPFLIRSFVRSSQHYIQRCLNTFVFTILFYESYVNVSAYIGLSKHTPTPTPNNIQESVSMSIEMSAQARARQRPLYDAINHEAEQNSREAKKIHSQTPTPTDS